MDETRLICPGCGAEYRLDAALIPDNGRQVECSSCGRIWFQPGRRETGAALTASIDRIRAATMPPPATNMPAPKAAASDLPRLNRPLPPEVLDILLDEARREREARAAEALTQEQAPEAAADQPEPADPPPAPARPTSDILPAITADTAVRHIHAAPHPVPAETDPEQLEATVTRTTPSLGTQAASAAAATSVPAMTLAADHRGNAARRGFGWGLALCALALLLYVAAPHVQETGPLADARASIDQGRLWLYGKATALVDPVVNALR